jgi:APA family basic amino acid/polyamine antiporter
MLTGIIVASIAALFPIHALAEMVNIGTLFAFVVVCAAVMIMRYTAPDQPRPFRCPWMPVIPILGILFNFGLMLSLGWHNWLRWASGWRSGWSLRLWSPPQPRGSPWLVRTQEVGWVS